VLAKVRTDALLVTHLPNIRYLCGFTGSAAALLLSEKHSIFFTDGRYTTQARQEVHGATVIVKRKSPVMAAAEWIKSNQMKLNQARRRSARSYLGIEADHLTVADHERLHSILPSSIRLRGTPGLVERARMVKDDAELAAMRTAASLGVELFESVIRNLHVGDKESEIAVALESAARKAGAEAMSFPSIIASGERSALPHARASSAPIAAGSFVVCDFGVILAGYCSDMTRTLYAGTPSAEARRVYQAVLAAQQAAVEAVRAGVSTGQIDRVARSSLRREGLAKYFTHSTGHGVGLEIHEAPRLAAAQTEVLKPGMVVTIEPGVYLPGRWGVRIEDTVVVTENGCEVLTPATRELIAV